MTIRDIYTKISTKKLLLLFVLVVVSLVSFDAIASCEPYEEVRARYREWGCLFCKPFQILFNTASVMAKQSFDVLAQAVIVVVVVAFGLWLCVVILRFVSTMEIREPRTFVKTLLNQAFRVIVVVVLLNAGLSSILSLTVDPVFSTGLKIAQLAGRMSESCDLEAENLAVVGPEQGGLSQAMGNSIICTIKSVQDQIVDVLALGRVCFCLSWSSENRVMIVFPHLGYLFTAIVFYISGVLLLLIYPFLLIDCILKLAIAVALLPAALGAFAFKITANYLNKIWEIFLNSMFAFIFMSIVIFIIASIAADALNEILTTEVGIFIRLFWWMIEVVKVVGICFLGWAVLGEIKIFADAFAKGLGFGGDGIGSPTGSSVMAVGKWAGLKAGKPVVNKAKQAGTAVKDMASEAIHATSINHWKDAATGEKRSFKTLGAKISQATDEDGNVMTDEDGNVMYNTTNFWQKMRGKKQFRSFSTDASGNTRMSVVTQTRKGKTTVTNTDAYATVTKKYDINGHMLSEDSQKNAFMLKHIMKKDGTYNQDVVNEFMQNSLINEQDKQVMFVKTVLNSRMSGEYTGHSLEDSYKNRTVEKGTDEEGHETITIEQLNLDGTTSTFKITMGGNNRVMSEIKTVDSKGNGKSFATDGIVQRKSYISTQKDDQGNNVTVVEDRYSFSNFYSSQSSRPLYSDGTTGSNIPADQIMFGQQDMEKFAQQVAQKGNKAFSFKEFQ